MIGSVPGERAQSLNSFRLKEDQPTYPTPMDNYISPGDSSFTLMNFPSLFDDSPTAEATPRRSTPDPPRLQSTASIQSLPAPESSESQVTDHSDNGFVHTDLLPPILPGSNRINHHSDNSSLAQNNLHRYNRADTSGISDPFSGDHGSTSSFNLSSRERLRRTELRTHGKDPLIQMLVQQEGSTDEARKLLRNVPDKLEQDKLLLSEAKSHCMRLERVYQTLTDARMLTHMQVTEAEGNARQALTAQRGLSIGELRLDHAEQSLATTRAELREASLQSDTAKVEVKHPRNVARWLREESDVREVYEKGRKSGFDEGVQRGYYLGIDLSGTGGTPQQLVIQAGEPLSASFVPPRSVNSSAVAKSRALTEDPNISNTPQATDGHAGSSSSKRNLIDSVVTFRGPRILQDAAVERALMEIEDRLQRELEDLLTQERHRLELLSLQQQRQYETEIQEEKERLKYILEQSVQLKDEVQRSGNRLRAERAQGRELLAWERERRVAAERDCERERERRLAAERDYERERERQATAERGLDLERERREIVERDCEWVRAVPEATANLAADASASAVASSRATPGMSDSEHEHSGSSISTPCVHFLFPYLHLYQCHAL
ncbi:hypothetical protein AN958_11501 [Leucoagaricus sp. SymC.cos]|nr:hypothetical protein AN958_11501 [Leucoagaricus sp. SymC.cos]